jgi:hypothetical protein
VVCSQEVFGVILAIEVVRGVFGDLVVGATEAGKFLILQFDGKAMRFVKLHSESYLEHGACRRICNDVVGGSVQKSGSIYR